MMKNNLSICAIFRNEVLYLKEWIEFHLLVGVEKFYLYNNRSDDNYLEILKPYIEKEIVVLTEWNINPPAQLEAYTHCASTYGKYSKWIAFIDIDEFLFSSKYNTVAEALNILPEQCEAIGVNWMCFGSGEQQEWEDKPVIERFTLRKNSDIPANNYIKSIIQPSKEFRFIDAHHSSMPTYSLRGRFIVGSHNPTHEYDILRINHYGSKLVNVEYLVIFCIAALLNYQRERFQDYRQDNGYQQHERQRGY